MSRRLALTHAIEMRWPRAARLPTCWLRLRPAPHAGARITAYSLRVQPRQHFLNWVRDPFENHLARLDVLDAVRALRIDVELIAEVREGNPFDFLLDPEAVSVPLEYAPRLGKDLAPFLHMPAPGAALAAWCAALDRAPCGLVERLDVLTRGIAAKLSVVNALTTWPPDVEALLARGGGSPADLAWLLTLSLRALGLASRFTSGYRIGSAAGDARADLHAWSEAYLPGAGWIGLDGAAGVFTTEAYIPLASTPEPLDARPLTGFGESDGVEVRERVELRALVPESPSWPYTAADRAAIDALGERVLDEARALGLPLALGREVALVAPDGAALAGGTRRMAETLALALRRRLAPGVALQIGQGPWYQGEPLPRWRLLCVFRADGRPVWREAARLGLGCRGGDVDVATARAFGETLARALGVSPACLRAAYEDALHDLWRAGGPPGPPPPADLRDPERRRALAESLTGERDPVGYVLPLRRDGAGERWQSGHWLFRRSRLCLVPGDSPMGYRLPLASLLPDAEAERDDPEPSPLAPRGPLPDVPGVVATRRAAAIPTGEPPGAVACRTALCVQPRDGYLWVFIPPLRHVEHYLELVAAIEAAADALDLPVALEGYEAPPDHRLRRLVLEPDVGLLRVSLPEAASWAEHCQNLEVVYEEAEAAGLAPERRLADGSRLPGGDGVVVLTGPTPDESPFLRRPDLVRSLVAYWQRHPSLPYLLAGRSIGPSSPACRPDERRDDAPHELEIALAQIPDGAAPPWLADRVLRHVLVDPGTDPRRAEIGVDELYDPERASGRLGRILLRSFATAPSPVLTALGSLLVAALVVRFARQPVPARLERWGAALRDRFLLPQPLWEDLCEVLRDLDAAGLPLRPAWFTPFLDLHFPVLGEVRLGDLALELRSAHEPWPVLAEESTRGGVTRFVDSANERVQVRVTGLVPSRHVLACNGWRVPLHPTATPGEHVAGVRYKACSPPSTLHPTTTPVAALVFDLCDTRTGRAVLGCTYTPPPELAPDDTVPAGIVDAGPPGPAPPAPARPSPAVPLRVPGVGRFVAHGGAPEPRTPREGGAVGYSLDLTRPS